MKRLLGVCMLIAIGLCMVETVEARQYRSQNYRRYTQSRFGGARPATGYGSNIHRNFVLRQEARRASQGYRVRNRGNILWFR